MAALTFLRSDGPSIAAAAYQGVTIDEPATDRVVEHLAAPGAIAGIAVAPNGRWVVDGSQDATLHGGKVPGGDDFKMTGFPRPGPARVRGQRRLDGLRRRCTVAFWDSSGSGPTGREGAIGQGHQAAITALAWHPDAARTLVTADGSGEALTWRLESDARARRSVAAHAPAHHQ